MALSESMPSISDLRRHLGFGVFLTFSQAVSGFVMAAVNIRAMTVVDFAGLAILLASATGVAHFLGQTLCAFAARESARFSGHNRSDDAGFLAFLLTSGVLATVVAYWLAHLLAHQFWQDASGLAAHLSGTVAACSVIALIAAGLLQGLGRPVRAHAGLSSQSSMALAMCLLCLVLGKAFSLELLMGIHAVSAAFVAVWMTVLAIRRTAEEGFTLTSLTVSSIKERLRFILPLLGSVGLGAVVMKLPIIFAGMVLTPSAVALLSIASQFGALARSVPSILSRSLSRSAQQAHRDNDVAGLSVLVRRAELVALASVGCMLLGFLGIGGFVLELGFGLESSEAFGLSFAMIALGCAQIVFGIRQGLLGMFGFTADVMMLKVIEVVVLVFGLVLVATFDLGLWAIIASMSCAFLIHTFATRSAMRMRSIFS